MKCFKLIGITLFIATVLPDQIYADSTEQAAPQIIAGPYLQKPMENSMTIMWVTNKNCTGYVNYGLSESMKNKAFSISSGLIDANKKNHRITIENLKPGTMYFYQVESTEIVKFEPYKVTFGEQVSSGIYKFKTLDNKKKQFSFLVLNDLHDNLELTKALLAPENINNCDLIFLNGDIISDPQNEGQIIKFLSTLTELATAQTPCLFVRGNHETRGRYARMFSDYIANPEESFYYSFGHGPVHFVVLDSGEDKEDSHWAYSGLNDFDGYRSIQAEWLKEEIKSQTFKNAKWQIALSHMPLFGSGDGHGTLDCRRKWAPLLNEAKIDLHISGHTHRYGLLEPDAEHNYPIFIGGAPRKDRATLIRVDVDTETINVTMTTDAGEAVQKYKINN